MSQILIDAVYPQEIRIVKHSLKEKKILNFDYDSISKKQLKGNIYLAKITRVEPSLQAVFVEYGDEKHGFLPFSEINTDYYQIPAADKQKLKDFYNGKSASNSKLKKVKSTEDDCVEEGSKTLTEMKKNLCNQYKIQEVIKKNQVILVQVIKEERGNKGVALSTYITLAGRYSVLMPNSGSKSGGVSRKIDGVSDRKRLRDLLKSFNLPESTSVILRTAAYGKTNEEISRDYQFLINSWNNIRQEALNSTAPNMVYQEADAVKRCIRDMYDSAVKNIIVDGVASYKRIKAIMEIIDTSGVKKIKEYKGKTPVFNHYKIENLIQDFYNTEVQLESGGYLVINITEALVSVDVNSGKATKERSVEDTALKTNLEAAREVARQLILRDLSGIIVIDFIDMNSVDNRKNLEIELKEAFSGDRARIQISRVSQLGLIEMSRQRLKPSLMETNMDLCSHCNGTGLLKSVESLSVEILRQIYCTASDKTVKTIVVSAKGEAIAYIFNYRRNAISEIESQRKIQVIFNANEDLKGDSFKVEGKNKVIESSLNNLKYDKAFVNSEEGKKSFRIFNKNKK